MYIYMYLCIFLLMHIHIYVSLYIFICVYKHLCIYVSMYVCMDGWMDVYLVLICFPAGGLIQVPPLLTKQGTMLPRPGA